MPKTFCKVAFHSSFVTRPDPVVSNSLNAESSAFFFSQMISTRDINVLRSNR